MTTTLQAAADDFLVAGNKLLAGDSSAFDVIWSEADDISMMGPTGSTYTGRAAVMTELARQSAMGFEGTLVADDRQLVESAEMGYVVCLQRTSGMTEAGEPIKIDIRVTTIFRKESGHWRVVHHHTDLF